jgi:hypothetical protein
MGIMSGKSRDRTAFSIPPNLYSLLLTGDVDFYAAHLSDIFLTPFPSAQPIYLHISSPK